MPKLLRQIASVSRRTLKGAGLAATAGLEIQGVAPVLHVVKGLTVLKK